MAALWVAATCAGHAAAQPQEPPKKEELPGLIEDLRDDDVRWNASEAVGPLARAGAAARPLLLETLDSEDFQQRQYAAMLLWWTREKPTPRQLAVTIEGLAGDPPLPEQRGAWLFFNMDEIAVSRLMPYIDTAESQLADALASDDYQQRFLAAYLLGMGGRDEHVDAVAPILLPHLLDNRTAGDAMMAGAALYRLGSAVLPHVESFEPHADAQARAMLELLRADLAEDAAGTADDFFRYRWGRRHGITQLYHDPIREYRPGYHKFGRIREPE